MVQAVPGCLTIDRRKDPATRRKPAHLRLGDGLNLGTICKISIGCLLFGNRGINVKAVNGRISGWRKGLRLGMAVGILDRRVQAGGAGCFSAGATYPVRGYRVIGPTARRRWWRWRAG